MISVGGFLGIGAKGVAVDFAQLQWLERADGAHRWVLATTADELMAASAFIWADSEEITGEPAFTADQEQEQMVDGDPNAVPIDPALTTDQPQRQNENSLDLSGFSDFDGASLTAQDILGIAVYGLDDQQIGTIGDVWRCIAQFQWQL
ncbi:MAG: hypothetical protein MO852_14770 [Candidatus Devosia euplotis]|nr:hypothetical protein [Candidatus Devosia euplotis]